MHFINFINFIFNSSVKWNYVKNIMPKNVLENLLEVKQQFERHLILTFSSLYISKSLFSLHFAAFHLYWHTTPPPPAKTSQLWSTGCCVELTRLVFLDDLHHLTHMQADLRALLLLVVCDCHILVKEKRVCSGRISCWGGTKKKTGQRLICRSSFVLFCSFVVRKHEDEISIV